MAQTLGDSERQPNSRTKHDLGIVLLYAFECTPHCSCGLAKVSEDCPFLLKKTTIMNTSIVGDLGSKMCYFDFVRVSILRGSLKSCSR